ncbi:MAG TPA: FMN-binding protein [Planctomycetota bacterium]|nr:FMN-binding protein [Planctomycetota bacterium]
MQTRLLSVVAILGAVVLAALMWVGPASAQAKMSHGQSEMQARKIWSAADELRRRGKWETAVKAYQKSLEVLALSGGEKTTLGMAATQMIELCEAMPFDVKQVADGEYEAQAWGYFAQIKVKVTVKGGKIRNFHILEHKETRPKGLEIVPRLIYKKQSPSVDAVTNATVTSYGLMTATLRALQKGKTDSGTKDATDTKKDAEKDPKEPAED